MQPSQTSGKRRSSQNPQAAIPSVGRPRDGAQPSSSSSKSTVYIFLSKSDKNQSKFSVDQLFNQFRFFKPTIL